ncbi:MAG TPA: sigma-70 family RNA polymerase sigma factor [Solirubrobacterales bacterium]|nr:sigma-70 family RNA polymerase sigma factor [Solirubrobacterales bacterium]
METYARNETVLRQTARRYSLCADDVDDALQRGLEILLRKAPTDDPRELIKWMQTVVKHEALAIRRERERILAAPVASSPSHAEDWIDLLPTGADGPAEKAERREEIARSREALRELKPQELRALTLLAEGYSYVEIGEITGYSRTKINRCLAEGRERYRNLVARSEDGRRCAELQPLLSAFCDGEAASEEVARVREHLRACAHCRATLRTYRVAPAAAAALAPALPLDRSLWERAHDAVAGLLARLGGGSTEPATQLAGGSAGGLGVAGVAKVAALCVGTAGGAAACVAGGIVPVPFDLSPARERPPLERRLSDRPTPATPTPTVAYEPEPVAPEPRPEPKPKPQPEPAPSPATPAATVSEPVVEAAPVASSGAAESAPAPAPEPTAAPAPAPSSGGGSPAGEFGP